jgi:hypothetical protein
MIVSSLQVVGLSWRILFTMVKIEFFSTGAFKKHGWIICEISASGGAFGPSYAFLVEVSVGLGLELI